MKNETYCGCCGRFKKNALFPARMGRRRAMCNPCSERATDARKRMAKEFKK